MPQGDERLYLAEILGAIDRVLKYTAEGREAFLADPKTQDAVVRNIEIIGEAVKALAEATRQANPEVPWSKICGTRDRLIHGYFSVDLDIIWDIVQADLPSLRGRVAALLPPDKGPPRPLHRSQPRHGQGRGLCLHPDPGPHRPPGPFPEGRLRLRRRGRVPPRRTLAFCVSKRHADFMADYFNKQQLRAVAVHSGDISAPRAKSLEELQAGQLDVMMGPTSATPTERR